MGNKSSMSSMSLNQARIFQDDESLNIIERLERICEVMAIPSDDHNFRILIESSINITSRNPHILLQIAEWHKQQTQCIPFNFEILTKNTAITTSRNQAMHQNQFVFKVSLTNKNTNNNQLFQTQFIEYINNQTLYNLNCVTNAMSSNGWISSFISCSYDKNKIVTL